MIITIDGPSGTGKSTVARLLAKKLGFSFFDTGALYRALAYFILDRKISLETISVSLSAFSFVIEEKNGVKSYFVNSVEVTDKIRTPEITQLASKIAAIGDVRSSLLPIQKEYPKGRNVVFEGRDLGSVVFPEAECKIFLTAKPEVRAERRYQEILLKDPQSLAKKEDVLKDLILRDEQDTNRDIAPLKCPEGAFVLDTSPYSKEDVVELLFNHITSQDSWKAG